MKESRGRNEYDGVVGRAGRGALLVGVLLAAGCANSPTSTPQAAAPAGLRVGAVDQQRILVETDAGKKARESLNSFMKNRQAVVELEEKELKRMEDELIKQSSVLSATAKKEREDQFRRRMMEYQQKVNEMNREVQEKQKDTLEGFRDKVEKVVAKVAQQMGVQIVLDKGRGGSTIYVDGGLDITQKVIDEFNRSAPDASGTKR